jgi:uncharacterized protein YbjT (DUF2867 family)
MEKKTILVVGATGNQGTAICNALFENGNYHIRAMVQDPATDKAKRLADNGAQLVQANLDDRASLDAACQGVYGVFAVLRFFQTHQEEETAQGVQLADAAKAAGVKHFIYSSAASAHRHTGVPHLESKWKIEQHIRRIGIPHTIFRPVAFNFSLNEFKDSVLEGFLPYAFNPDTMVFQVDENDYARHILMAFDDPDHWLGMSYDVASESMTAQELAAIFGRVVGKQVVYRQISWQEEVQAAGQEVVNLMQWIEHVGPDIHVPSRRREFTWLTSFEEYLLANGWGNIAVPSQTQVL